MNRETPITVEHEGNRGIRIGDWKLVAEWDKPWELYNITDDRTEQNNLIDGEKDRAKAFEKAYFIHLLQEMLEHGIEMRHSDTANEYIEIDTQQDFEYAQDEWQTQESV